MEINKISIANRRYLGAKTRLLPFIDEVMEKEKIEGETFLDLFGGTGVVGHYFLKDFNVLINDFLYSNFVTYNAWFNFKKINTIKVDEIIDRFNIIDIDEISENYVSKNFKNTFFSWENCKKIGYYREEIELLFSEGRINIFEKYYLLTSLLYSMDSIANTVGHYDAYFEKMKDKKLVLKKLNLTETSREVKIFNSDANTLVQEINADVVYIDPPYNSRQYSDAYHFLENIMEWKKPEVFGKAKKMDRKNKKSLYCSVKAKDTFAELIDNIKAEVIIVSYNNMEKKGSLRSQNKISNNEIEEILSKKGETTMHSQPFQYFNTGKSDIKGHEEILFVCKVNVKTKKKKHKKN